MVKRRGSVLPARAPSGAEAPDDASVAALAPLRQHNRRAFLRNAALVGAGGGAAMLAGMRDAERVEAFSASSYRLTLSGSTYGGFTLDPSGASDSQSAIQAAINDVSNAGGGVVELPAGNYLLASHGLQLHDSVVLQGVGWTVNDASGNWSNGGTIGQAAGTGTVSPFWQKGGNGTWLIVGTGNPEPAIRIGPQQGSTKYNGQNAYEMSGAVVRDLAILHQQNDPTGNSSSWVPRPIPELGDTGSNPTDFAIRVEGAACVIDNIFIPNATGALYVIQPNIDTGASTAAASLQGQSSISRIYSGAIKRGIVVDSCGDVIRFRDIHLWPFWYSAGNWGAPGAQPSNVNAYRLQNGVGVQLMRCDNVMFSDMYILGYRVGIEFSVGGQYSWTGSEPSSTPTYPNGFYDTYGTSGGPWPDTIGANFVNVGVDQSITGVLIDQDVVDIWAMFTNLSIYGVPTPQGSFWASCLNGPYGWGVCSLAVTSRLMFNNLSIEGSAYGCMLIQPTTTTSLSGPGTPPAPSTMIKNIVMIDGARLRWWNGNSSPQYAQTPYYAVTAVTNSTLGSNSDPYVYLGNRALNMPIGTTPLKYNPLSTSLSTPGVFVANYGVSGSADWL